MPSMPMPGRCGFHDNSNPAHSSCNPPLANAVGTQRTPSSNFNIVVLSNQRGRGLAPNPTHKAKRRTSDFYPSRKPRANSNRGKGTPPKNAVSETEGCMFLYRERARLYGRTRNHNHIAAPDPSHNHSSSKRHGSIPRRQGSFEVTAEEHRSTWRSSSGRNSSGSW